MAVKFWNYNLVDQDATVITASDENALFPVENIKDTRSTKVFRSSGSSTILTFDFVTTEAIDSILLQNNFKTGWGFTTPVTVEANPTDTWGAPAFSTTITNAEVDQEFGIAIKEFASQSYRFWRLSFTGSSYVEVSKVFMGSLQQIETRSVSFGWGFQDQDLSESVLNRYGQKFTDIITSQKRIQFSFNVLTKDQIDIVLNIFGYNRTYKPFFFQVTDCEIFNNMNRVSGRFTFDEIPVVTNNFYSLYDLSAVISEAK